MKSLSAIFLLLWASVANGAEYRFFDISVPDARHTIANGLNDLGDVVGIYTDCDICSNAASFIYTDGQYYEVGVAGATRVFANAINRNGVIAGQLVYQGHGGGFIMDDQQTTLLDQAGDVDGINNNEAAVGWLSTPSFNMLAYKWKDGKYTQIVTPKQVPGILGSAATGINNKGDIVGYWWHDVDGIHVKTTGFVRKAGKLTPIDLIPLGINADGVIVGLSGAGLDGAVLENGVVTLIKVPGADYTQVHGINNKGHLVGYYVKAGVMQGFIGKPVVAKVANGKKK